MVLIYYTTKSQIELRKQIQQADLVWLHSGVNDDNNQPGNTTLRGLNSSISSVEAPGTDSLITEYANVIITGQGRFSLPPTAGGTVTAPEHSPNPYVDNRILQKVLTPHANANQDRTISARFSIPSPLTSSTLDHSPGSVGRAGAMREDLEKTVGKDGNRNNRHINQNRRNNRRR